MYRIVGNRPAGAAFNPIDLQFLNQLSVLASDRNERIIGTKPRIPVLLWAALIFGGVVLVALTGFLRLGSLVGHAVVSSTIAVLLGLLLCIVFAFDHSFANDHQITAAPFKHALEIFDAVDRGS
jgi:purine-cytosine permease-like protein